ncbi:hypothetical protein ACFVJ8_04190 [Streptomyces yangpuensis]|uniref:hypothetical protein n=1 Tax=Streptomyces yangpuensis TaxID=1648182 RepID=UPI00364251EF
MTHPPQPPAAFGLSFHPEALNDLLAAPGDMRDLGLALIQDVVRAEVRGGKLTGELSGYRKLYLGSRGEWRIVYAHRPAPPGSSHPTDIHVVAVRPRAKHDIYDTVRARVGRPRPAAGPRAYAARSLSPQVRPRPAAMPAPPVPAFPVPGLPVPARITTTSPKGPSR